jgi:hypothetical protein
MMGSDEKGGRWIRWFGFKDGERGMVLTDIRCVSTVGRSKVEQRPEIHKDTRTCIHSQRPSTRARHLE